MAFEKFMEQFRFRPELAGRIAVEREGFLVNQASGAIVPAGESVLAALQHSAFAAQYEPELSACQIEYHTGPQIDSQLRPRIELLETELQRVLSVQGLRAVYQELAPATMPTDVYPKQRYRDIKRQVTSAMLLSACRVAGTHVHVGMSDFETARLTFNRAIKELPQLIKHGDFSEGKRLQLYQQMTKYAAPQPIESADHFYQLAVEQGFVDDPRSCWWLIRITVHGTIEFRPFGAVTSINTTMSFVDASLAACQATPMLATA